MNLQPKEIWVLIDQDNGNERSKFYCWWFPTRKMAREHKKWQIKQKYSARLTGPFKFVRA